jgi:ribosomal-protein-alanine N-acetyltransferase
VGATGWPASLVEGRVGVRPLRLRDGHAWCESRIRNTDWLAPWEGHSPTMPKASWEERHSPAAFTAMLRIMRRESRAGRSLPFAITYDGELAGQVTVANVIRGAFHSASVGYWVDAGLAGRGVMPTALALVVDHCFAEVGLHRIEANIRPENTPSLRVVQKLGFREEGLHPRFLHIDGAWRDHLCFALTVEDVPDPLVTRLSPRQTESGRHTE